MEDAYVIAQLLMNEAVVDNLYKELASAVDYKSLPYEIGFIPSEYYQISHELKAKPYFPESKFLIEDNLESTELVIPKGVLRITPMLRPRKDTIESYLRLLGTMGVRKVYFQPFYDHNNVYKLTLFGKPMKGGGVIVRIGDVKQYDIPNPPKES